MEVGLLFISIYTYALSIGLLSMPLLFHLLYKRARVLAISLWLSGIVINQTLKGVAFLSVVVEVSPSIVKAMANYHKGDLRFRDHFTVSLNCKIIFLATFS